VKIFSSTSRYQFRALGLGVFLAIAAIGANAQTFTYNKNALSVDVIVSNPCNGLTNNGFVTFKVISSNGPVILTIVLSPNGFLPGQVTIGTTGSSYVYTDPGPDQQGDYGFIIHDNTNSINATGASPSPAPMVDLSPISINLVTKTNNSNCITPNGDVVASMSGGSESPALSVPGSFTYTWTSNNGTSGLPLTNTFDGTSNLDLSVLLGHGLAGGIYTLSIVDNYSACAATTQNFTITDPSPIAYAVTTSTPSICLGSTGTVNLSNSETSVNYEIYKGGVATGIVQAGTTGTPLIFTIPAAQLTPAASYSFTIRGVNGSCTPAFMSGTATILVNSLPTITGTLTICANGTTQLTGSGTPAAVTPWQSSNTGVATISNTGLVTAVAAGSTTITYTDNNGCQKTATVTVNALPTITGTLSICANGTTQLTGSGTPAAVTPWQSSNTGVATISNTGLVTAVAAGSTTITYTDNNGCQKTATVTVNALPTITGTLSICANGTTQLTGSGTPAAVTPWQSSNTGVATISNTGLVTAVAAGSTTITYTDNNGCQKTATVTVNALPTITGTLSICANGTTQLTGSGTPAAVTPWQSSNTGVATISNTGLVTAVAAGSTTITYTDNNGCQKTATVTVNALPTITGTLSICANGTTQLTGSGTPAAVTPWQSSNTGVATISNTGLVTAVAAGSTTITYTDNNGCQKTATVTVNALPTITGTLSICANGTTQLTGSGTPAAVTPWQSSNTGVATISNTGLVTAASVGSTVITYTDNNGCQQTATVTVNALPTITGTLTVCANGTTQLTGSGTPAAVTPWQSSNTGVATISNTGLVTAVAAGTTTITYTDNNGCQNTATVNVTALPLAPTVTSPVQYCQNAAAVPLTATGSNLLWYTVAVGGVGSATAPTPATTTVGTTSYFVSQTVSSCEGPRAQIDVIINADPPSPGPGTDTWVADVYSDFGNVAIPYQNGVDFSATKYRGFLVESEIGAFGGSSSYNSATDAFDMNLSNNIPLAGTNVCGSYLDNYSIRFQIKKTLTAGIYTFTLGSDDGVRFYVDGSLVPLSPANSFSTHAYNTYTASSICITAGVHDLVIEYFEDTGFSRISFDYSSIPVPVPSVTISASPSSTICAGVNVTFTATPTNGGATPSYQWTKNAINVGTNSATYADNTLANGDQISVVMTTSLTCVTSPTAASTPITMTVNPNPVAPPVTFSPSSFCVGQTITTPPAITSPTGTSTYNWYSDAALTTLLIASATPTVAQLNFSTAAANTTSVYVTETTSSNCTGPATTVTLTVNALPTASLTGTTTICAGNSANLTVNFTGASPWIFTYSDGATTSANINSNFSVFTLPVSPVVNTTYSIMSVSDANCAGTVIGSSAVVSVDSPPDATLAVSAAVSPLCTGGTTTVDIANSEVGVSYQLRNGVTTVGSAMAGTGATLSLPTGALAVTTTFNVLATRGVCTPVQLNNTVTVTVAGAINAGLTVTPQAATVCSGTATNIQVAASENGVNYQLRDNSNNSNIGSVVAGTGATISLPTGNLNTNTTFNILASNGTCSVQLTTLATVNVDINPNPGLAVGATINPLCSGGSTNVTVAGSEIGVSYQLRDAANNPIGAAVAGTGGTINLATGSLAATTTFNVLATGGATCPPVQLTNTVMVTVAGVINAGLAVTSQAPSVCSGSGTNIQVANSEVGVNYQLQDNSNNSNIGPVVAGTGATINLPTGNLAIATTYDVLATNGTCSIQLTTLATVNVDINPNIGLTTAASINPVCSGGSSSITVANSEVGVSYQLRDASNTNVGTAVAGTGGTISLPTSALAATATFNVLASSGVCTSVQLTNTVTVNVGGSLNIGLTITAQSASICSGTATNIQVANSEVGVTYQLRDDSDDSLIGTTVAGTGATINLPTGNLAATITFNVLASNGVCSIEMTTLATVTVNTQPNAGLGVTAQNAAVCTGTATNIQVAGSEVGVSYQLRDNSNNSLIGSTVAGTGATINLPTGNLTVNTTFNVLATGGGSCSVQLTATASVSVLLATDPLCTGGGGGVNCGVFTLSATDTRPTCSGQDDGTITVNVSGGTPNYTVTLSDATQGFSQSYAGPGPLFTFGNLSPSLTYKYTVHDGVGNTCTLDYSLPIQTNVQANAAGFVDAKCFNQAVGQATVTVTSGGTSPYEYSLDAGSTWVTFTSPVIISNLAPAAAPYAILVRDDAADLCPAQVMVTINNAVTDILVTSTTTDATCANNDGVIQITSVSGGTGPYTYQMDGVATDSTSFHSLSGGNHIFTITDANSCVKNFPFIINFPGLVNFTVQTAAPDCSGTGNNGSITVLITSSGTFDVGVTTDPINDPAVFQTVVSAGSTSVVFPGLSQATYYVVAKPTGALCPSRSLVTINGGPFAVDFGFKPNNFLCFESKGIVDVFGIKGSLAVDYSYEIISSGNIVQSGTITQNQALDTVLLTGLDKGSYQIHLFQDQSAATGCTNPISSAFKNFSISGPTASLDTLYVNRVFSQPNLPTGSMLIGIQESNEKPYQVKLQLLEPVVQGQKNLNAFDSVWQNATWNNVSLKYEFDATALYAGSYRLYLKDTLGCTRTYDLSIDFNKTIYIPNVFTPNNDNKNENFEILNLPDNSSIVITNRWGKEVFNLGNIPKKDPGEVVTIIWNGGAEVDGVYYYKLNAGGKVYSGWVEILRGN